MMVRPPPTLVQHTPPVISQHPGPATAAAYLLFCPLWGIHSKEKEKRSVGKAVQPALFIIILKTRPRCPPGGDWMGLDTPVG